MIVFPNCKINIGLYVTQKRSDGYHTIETIFYPVALEDALEIHTPQQPLTTVQFTATGLPIGGAINTNLCVKAVELLQAQYPQIKNVDIHLHKVIPMGAGLGGGSANGAYTLQLLNKMFHLQISHQQLIEYALQLGSDCPFFIINQPCFATGRGEILQPIPFNLQAYYIAIVNPQIHINTGWAFSKIVPQATTTHLQTAILQPIETWQQQIENQFEKAAIEQYPEINAIKNNLYSHGAIYASMSGTGSTVYGIFKEKPSLQFPSHYFVHISKGL